MTLTAADIERLRAAHGLDQPLHERYFAWLSAVLRGEFGFSRLYAVPAAQVLAAAFVAQPAGDADVPVLVEVVEQLLAGAGEAVHHRRAEPAVELLHDRHEVGMRVALVQEQRLAGVDRDLQLAFEGLALRRARREVAEIVETALADGDDLRIREQRAHFGVAFLGVFDRVVRMHAGGGVEHTRVLLRQRQRFGRVFAAGAGNDQLRNAGRTCAFQHRVAIPVEAVVGEVGADVDELHAAILSRGRVHGR